MSLLRVFRLITRVILFKIEVKNYDINQLWFLT